MKIPIKVGDLFWFMARLFVGGIFAYAGFMKLMEPRGNFEAALAAYPLLPEGLRLVIASILPWCEWILGVLLILGYAPIITGTLICFLLAGFLILMGSGLLLGKGSHGGGDCGCFGQRGIKLSPQEAFLLDFISLVLVVFLLRLRQFSFSLDSWIRKSLSS